MKTTKLFQLTLALVTWALFTAPGTAAPFNSGSDGSFGDLIVTNEITLPLPTNGVLNCRKVMVSTNGVLKFQRNALNTPVMLLATEEVLIEGKIILDGTPGSFGIAGSGGPGGFDGGRPGQAGFPPAWGRGPGGGTPGVGDFNNASRSYGGSGSFATTGYSPAGPAAPPTYGDSLLLPMAGGSGGGGDVGNGGPQDGGGGGGGAILMASNVRITLLAPLGRVQANGGGIQNVAGLPHAGSGGAIRLVAPTIDGNGALSADGDYAPGQHVYGQGRIRLDSPNQSNARFSMVGVWTRGVLMLTKLPNEPRLDVIQVAGQNIAPGEPALVVLPNGSPSQRQIIVQAKDFNDTVPIRVALALEYGSPIFVDATITNTTQNPATVSIPVTFPINAPVTVNVWTR